MGSSVTRLAIEAPHFHIQKPDADNLAKFALDCLTGLAYHDDAQICDCTSKKRWTHHRSYQHVKIKYLEKLE